MISSDEYWMRKALQMAKKGRGLCSPNPMVGAVVVKDGKLIGKGYHQKAGEAHAEVNALRSAGAIAEGADVYVTLEPCCTFGRTPPCTSALLKAKVRRVIIGCMDANPNHRGKAVKILGEGGIEVSSNILEKECRLLNEHFFWWIQEKRPYVCLKMAMTLDGKIATKSGDSQWITGAAARNYVQKLRKLADAIMVGGETARLDNPSLKVKSPKNWPMQPKPYIWTSRELPDSLSIKSECRAVKPQTQKEWIAFLSKLGRENCSVLLLEGGGELAASALQAGIVNKVYFFVAPKILCGRSSRPVVSGENPSGLADALPIEDMKCKKVGDDFLWTGYYKNVYRNY
ncbi:MAG: bifunctional diaminohydroxyphosphoribosylaminopyrimidine deaminase/5-amino-6-(5-phosphoribosylamino)uracil reductase RibD [Lentisphaeria bacterium]